MAWSQACQTERPGASEISNVGSATASGAVAVDDLAVVPLGIGGKETPHRARALVRLGLRVALGVHSPKQMTDVGWRVELFVDERANLDQAKALAAIFSGAAGGHLANVVPLIGEVAGVRSAPIIFEIDGRKRRLRVDEAL